MTDHDAVKQSVAAMLRDTFGDAWGGNVVTERHLPTDDSFRRIDVALELGGGFDNSQKQKFAFEIKTTIDHRFSAQLGDAEDKGWKGVIVYPNKYDDFYSAQTGHYFASVTYSNKSGVIEFTECDGLAKLGLARLSDTFPREIKGENCEPQVLNCGEQKIISVLEEDRANAPLIAEETGYSTQYVRERLGRLKKDEIVSHLGHGMYAINETKIPEQEGVNE
jgi:hypothetical protein